MKLTIPTYYKHPFRARLGQSDHNLLTCEGAKWVLISSDTHFNNKGLIEILDNDAEAVLCSIILAHERNEKGSGKAVGKRSFDF